MCLPSPLSPGALGLAIAPWLLPIEHHDLANYLNQLALVLHRQRIASTDVWPIMPSLLRCLLLCYAKPDKC